jgi:predicted lipoprotein with Yx(FWY)xxD motif
MKRIAAIVVVIIILVAGGFALFHNSNNDNNSTKTSTSSANASKSTVPAVNNAVLITKTDSKLGQYLADPSGKALYNYNADSNGVSNCSGSCLSNWPAYVDKGSTTNLPAGVGVIKRSDNGQMQYTFNGKPLYYFTSDGSGQVTGDGVENFSVAKPATPNTSSSSSSSSSTTTGTGSQSTTTDQSNSASTNYPY